MRTTVLALVVMCVCATGAQASGGLPPLPARWPKTLELGMMDLPGDAAALRKAAPFGFRYQYLAGGVNTGQGWATWNPGGSFVTRYDRESWAAGEIPVFSYYMLLQSKPAGGDEAQVDLSHLRDAELMRAYWADVRLFFRRAHGTKTVVLHVEPDLWGYLEQAGDVSLARSFAQEFVRLRDQLAPNVLLAYHMSGWGTKHDIVYEDPSDAVVRGYAAQSAAFYRALDARFDVAFEDFSDRDAGFYAKQQGNAKTWFTPADFARFYIQDSIASGIIPVFTYYMLLQSLPGGGGESAAVFANLNNTATMTAYYNDLTLFFQKAAAFPSQTIVFSFSAASYSEQRSMAATKSNTVPPAPHAKH